MRDVIKTDRARRIISFLTGKVVNITEVDGDNISREKIVTGIYGCGEVLAMGQVCLAFQADYGKDDSGTEGAQLTYEEWEELIDTGCVLICDFMKIELCE